MSKRSQEQILKDILKFEPLDGNWLTLESLLTELWQTPITNSVLPVLFGIFEKFPEEDGGGVFWSIVHGVESLGIPYESQLRESQKRKPSSMAKIMISRIENSEKKR